MNQIPEETSNQQKGASFDNKAYLSLNYQVDSGFGSYEEVKTGKRLSTTYENIEHPDDYPNYENLEEESYEKVETPVQKLNFVPPPPLLPDENLQETYENLDFQPNNADFQSENYQNIDFEEPSKKKTEKKVIPVYATLKKAPLSIPNSKDLDDTPVYENYDFQEQAIYQNMAVSNSGKMLPISESKRRQSAPSLAHCGTKNSTDVYAQVKILRKSVQEVNAMLEQPKKSNLILQRTKELEKNDEGSVKPANFRRNSTTSSVKRSSNFKSILNKFNVMSTNSNQNSSEVDNSLCNQKQRKSLTYATNIKH